ncbi:MAG: replicative DNA helicase [Prevotellaceae bacterium]|jgi:replicative DNA helicase|nr:replicative DNA helicase [Prevotellaceae bacterium]
MKNQLKNQMSPTLPIDALGVELSKIPPHAEGFEKAVLGALLLESDAVDDVQQMLGPECFYNRTHETIYRAILRLNTQRKPVDMLSVADALKQSGELDEIGGNYYLSKLTLEVSGAAHLKYHAQVVFEKYLLRQFIYAGYQITTAGFDEAGNVDEALSVAESKVNEIAMQIAGKMDIAHVRQSVNIALNEAIRRVENATKNICSGIRTGLVDLDKITNGWQKSNLIILAARPSMGKTAMMLHFAKTAARAGHATVIFSLEMSDVSLTNRLILSECGISPDRFRSGYMDKNEITQMEMAGGVIENLPIYIDDNSDVAMNRIRARARALKKQGKCGIVFIDYLQLCREKGTSNRNREQEVSAMSREAKIMAKELDIPVILLSQLSREVEKRQKNGVPHLSDLRDSGAIEQDADLVIFIYRPAYYGATVEDKQGNIIDTTNYGELLIEKHRDGACGRVKFRHNVGMTHIEDYWTGSNNAPEIPDRNEPF